MKLFYKQEIYKRSEIVRWEGSKKATKGGGVESKMEHS